MKILHVCFASFFPDNYSYQENLLPKFHKLQGHDVEVIASIETFDVNGKITCYDGPLNYINENGILVKRFKYKSPNIIFNRIRSFAKFDVSVLEEVSPNIIFIHGCQFVDIKVFVNYLKKHPEVIVYVDNHADFSNSARNWLSKNLLHKLLWKHCAQLISPYTKKFYGVLPARVDFLVNLYRLPKDKCELLVMGADDELVQKSRSIEQIKDTRARYNIKDDEFLVVTGGKIDLFKTQTLLLMEAIKESSRKKIKLIVFGPVVPELKEKLCSYVDNDRIIYIGWIDSKESYKYFAAADLVVFPGRHSVFWEQVVAQGKPLIVKSWDGTHHVDLGGNTIFLNEDSVAEIKNSIENVYDNPSLYAQMKRIAENEGMKHFSYNDIAKRAIEC